MTVVFGSLDRKRGKNMVDMHNLTDEQLKEFQRITDPNESSLGRVIGMLGLEEVILHDMEYKESSGIGLGIDRGEEHGN